MVIPQGVVYSNPNQVCKLDKSLYGLKQASRQWYSKLSNTLTQIGYTQSAHNNSLFTKSHGTNFIVLLIYVDDLILAGNCPTEITFVKQHLHDLFKIKDLGPLKYFLGFEITRSSKDSSGAYTNPNAYRRLVGRLLYISNYISDLSFSVQQLSQYMNQPTNAHYQALTRILKYIKETLVQGLFYPSNSTLQLKAFSDSDWATCTNSRRYVSRFCVFLGNSLVSWKSKKQSNVARSSSEAEYSELATTSCELQWLTFNLTVFPSFSSNLHFSIMTTILLDTLQLILCSKNAPNT
ncbi:PREDICTED: uncharacterized protein LOC109337215 [Lupinus angustifolius]|uniref:uncharacterized protein LOC109337215 n=1 Tax=Lupinus angustifolius TaxID=3871 RepID=UPI00092E3DEE|nr:PREDICTED: uncharacterized protein LOC109337215 [Lupinus angustifolius]